MALAPSRHVLPGGPVVLVNETRTMPAVTVLAALRAGAVYDAPGAEGTAALVARVLDRGTTTRTAAGIADDLDGRGASLFVTAGRHQLTVSATALADDFDAILALVADIVREPAFAEHEVATRRGELVTTIRQHEDDPGSRAVDRLMALLYPGHPYGRPVRGTAASVEALDRAALVRHHASWCTPEGLAVVIVGDIEAAHAEEACQHAFDGWQANRPPDPALPPVTPAAGRRIEAIRMPSKAQADIAYGFTGLGRSDPDYYAAWVMNHALGQFAIGGRLGDNIRERQGMAYYVFSGLDASLAPGPLTIRAGVAAADVERTIAAIDAEIAAILRDGFTAGEIDDSKAYLIGSLPRQLETNTGIAAFLLNAELFGLGLAHDARLPGLIADVAHDQVQAAARRLLDPARATVVVAGPWGE
ncbi:MAG: pitrilysin family protein [Acidobacteriota bacterium]